MTIFWKFIFPGLWLGAFAIGTISSLFILSIDGLFFLIGLILGFAVIYFTTLRAKVVHIDDAHLYVNNFRKSIKVPLKNIKHVSDDVPISPRPIFVEFIHETEFGKKIMFIGYTDLFLLFSTHPAVKEIKERMKN